MMFMDYEIAQLKRPIQTEPEHSVCGDITMIFENERYLFLAVFDGAGHGLPAYKVAQQSAKVVENNWERLRTKELVELLHSRLRGSRGGVISLCKVEKATGESECCGVGNISIILLSSSERRLVTRGGVLGYEITTPLIHTEDLSTGSILILHSDGISERLKIEDIPDFNEMNAETLARIIIDYHSKPLDDASVIVLKVKHD